MIEKVLTLLFDIKRPGLWEELARIKALWTVSVELIVPNQRLSSLVFSVQVSMAWDMVVRLEKTSETFAYLLVVVSHAVKEEAVSLCGDVISEVVLDFWALGDRDVLLDIRADYWEDFTSNYLGEGEVHDDVEVIKDIGRVDGKVAADFGAVVLVIAEPNKWLRKVGVLCWWEDCIVVQEVEEVEGHLGVLEGVFD